MTKKEIIKKIEKLFYNKSFANVSMQDIAVELWMKKASLYYHFLSKDDILKEVIEQSFQEYNNFINKIIILDLWDFIKSFLYYPEKNKNLFSIINQNWYCENTKLKGEVMLKQKQILQNISSNLKQKYNFSVEKSFLLISILEDIWRKKCIFWSCPIDSDMLLKEIQNLFIKN